VPSTIAPHQRPNISLFPVTWMSDYPSASFMPCSTGPLSTSVHNYQWCCIPSIEFLNTQILHSSNFI
jgi:hypothetical protein